MIRLALLLTAVLLCSCASTPASAPVPPTAPTLPKPSDGPTPLPSANPTHIEGRVPATLTNAHHILGNETTSSPELRPDGTFTVDLNPPERMSGTTFPAERWLSAGLPASASCQTSVTVSPDLRVALISEFLVFPADGTALGAAYLGSEGRTETTPSGMVQVGTVVVWLYASQDQPVSGRIWCDTADAAFERRLDLQLKAGWNWLYKTTSLNASTQSEVWQNEAPNAVAWQFRPQAAPP